MTGKYKMQTDNIDGYEIQSAYTLDGHYIGTEKVAKYLIDERGINPEPIAINHSICSIGFCDKEQKWYGWSHRAIYGFGIGSVVDEGDCGYDSRKGKWSALTLDDAKQMAIDFAEDVA